MKVTGFSRRDLFKMSLMTAGSALALNGNGTSSGNPGGVVFGNTLTSSSGLVSPPMTPWVDPLPIPQVLQPLAGGLSPAFTTGAGPRLVGTLRAPTLQRVPGQEMVPDRREGSAVVFPQRSERARHDVLL
jgi:hypothetical protein